jgi:RNA polymerase sigma-70 factor (ECF subfamily)
MSSPTIDLPRTFEDRVLQHRDALLSAARRLTGDPLDAEDLVQETLLRAYARRDSLRHDDNVKGWLLRVQRNLFINDYWRRRTRARVAAIVSVDSVDPHGETLADVHERSPEQLTIARHAAEAARGALSRLPDVYRETVVMCLVDGRSYDDVARTLGISSGTVRSRVFRGRERLRRTLAGWGDVPAAAVAGG